ncbi:hypothetical protein [Paenibacillus tyrfis]|uniref:hypothetical protein n=1 Tax=Paenibacillus tyrfis TaxID=1501230 RepID=UPI00209DBC53|nr:hypothetical protein [Paenibacillus tyrfis]MCP1308127.1 hypothetical protein [Paenibacillus tyrfis]
MVVELLIRNWNLTKVLPLQIQMTERLNQNQIKPIEKGPGPLTKENTSVGGIHIRDTQEKVKSLFGELTKVTNSGGGTPEVEWYYEKQNARILFYRNSEKDPVDGVENILLTSPSSLKTDKNIGIGDSSEQLMKSYQKIEVDALRTSSYQIILSITKEDATRRRLQPNQ